MDSAKLVWLFGFLFLTEFQLKASASRCYQCVYLSVDGTVHEGSDYNCRTVTSSTRTTSCPGACSEVTYTSSLTYFGVTSSSTYYERNCNIYSLQTGTCLRGSAFENFLGTILDDYEFESITDELLDLISYTGSACACTGDRCTGSSPNSSGNNVQPMVLTILLLFIASGFYVLE